MEADKETEERRKLDEAERVEMFKGKKQKHDVWENTPCVVGVHSLPAEVMEKILLDAIAQELLEHKLTKFQQKGFVSLMIDERVDELKSVCRKWKSVLSCSTELLQSKVLLQLRCAGLKPISILVKSYEGKYSSVAKLHRKLYIFVRISRIDFSYSLEVYRHDGDDIELEDSKTLKHIKNIAFCVACHNCVYVLADGGVWKFNPQDLSESLWLPLGGCRISISVSKDGNLIVTDADVVKIYGANAEVMDSVQLDINQYLDFIHRGVIVAEKSNGNFVVSYVSMAREPRAMKFYIMEFARDGTVVWDLENSPERIKGELWLDSDDRIMVIDCNGRGFYVIDPDGKGYDRLPLWDLFVTPLSSYVSDALYDAEENLLYITIL